MRFYLLYIFICATKQGCAHNRLWWIIERSTSSVVNIVCVILRYLDEIWFESFILDIQHTLESSWDPLMISLTFGCVISSNNNNKGLSLDIGMGIVPGPGQILLRCSYSNTWERLASKWFILMSFSSFFFNCLEVFRVVSQYLEFRFGLLSPWLVKTGCQAIPIVGRYQSWSIPGEDGTGQIPRAFPISWEPLSLSVCCGGGWLGWTGSLTLE